MRFVYGVTPVVAGRKYLVYVESQRLHAIAQYDALSQFWCYPGDGCVGPGRVTAFWELDATTGVAPDRAQVVAEAPPTPSPAPTTAPAPAPRLARPQTVPVPGQALMPPPPPPSRFTLLEVD